MQDIRIRHFFNKRNGRLIATIATLAAGDNSVMMAVARCNPKDLPSKKEGRDLAISRLQRLFLLKNNLLHGQDLILAQAELSRNLITTISRKELLDKVIKENPFVRGNCKFGKPINIFARVRV